MKSKRKSYNRKRPTRKRSTRKTHRRRGKPNRTLRKKNKTKGSRKYRKTRKYSNNIGGVPGEDPKKTTDSKVLYKLIMKAAADGNTNNIVEFINYGEDPNNYSTPNGATPLFIAAQEGHVEAVALLLDHKADPNQAATTTGATPLINAAHNGHLEVVKVLLAADADRFVKSKWGTALDVAATTDIESALDI